MIPYNNIHGNSGVKNYEIIPQGIALEFEDGAIYVYTDTKTGKNRIAKMKQLAQKGLGLATFISKEVRERFAEKIR